MENELNEVLEELFGTVEHSLPKKNAQVNRSVERSRLTVADILAKYANPDGTIPRNKITAIQQELLKVEGEIYRNLRDELRRVLEAVAEESTITLAEAVIAIVGLTALIEVAGIPESLADLVVGIAEAIFSALTGLTYREHTESATNSAFNRKGETDGKQLNERLRSIALVIRKEIEVTLRESIRKGEGTAEIIRKVERIFKSLSWRLYTIVETEILYVLRQVVAKFAELSGLVKALRIVDFPHGKPGEHERHRCHIFANSDEHGLGKGTYPVGTRKIRNPHPRCRSKLFFVLTDELS